MSKDLRPFPEFEAGNGNKGLASNPDLMTFQWHGPHPVKDEETNTAKLLQQKRWNTQKEVVAVNREAQEVYLVDIEIKA